MRRCYLSKTDICWLIWHFRSAKSRNFHQPTVGFGRQLHARADITLILLISAVFESLIETKTVKIKSQRYISPLKKDFYPITRNLDPIPKFCLISMSFHPMVKRGGRTPLISLCSPDLNLFHTKLTFTCSKSTTEKLEKGDVVLGS